MHPLPTSHTQLYKLPSLTLERSACRFNLTLRALSFSPDGTKLAAAGDDNLIKLVEVKDGSVSCCCSRKDSTGHKFETKGFSNGAGGSYRAG